MPARRPQEQRRAAPGEAWALAFAMAFPTFAVWLYFGALLAAARPVYTASKVVQFAFPAVWALLVERTRPRPPLVSPTRLDLAAGLASGLAFAGVVLAAYHGLLAGGTVLAGAPREIRTMLGAFGITTPAGFALLATFYSVVHSLLEEYYWRWFVFGRLRRHLSLPAAVALSALAFMAHHVVLIGYLLGSFGPAVWLFSLAVAAGGAAWALLYHRSGTLWGAWLSHALVDAALMWVGYRLWALGG